MTTTTDPGTTIPDLTGAVASKKNCQNCRRSRFLVLIILLLYLLGAVNLYGEWAQVLLCTNVKTFWETTFESNNTLTTPVLWTMVVGATLSAVLADATSIWRCWLVWSQSWSIVVVPIACTIVATVRRSIITYYSAFGSDEKTPPQALFLESVVSWSVLYSSLILATLLWCTILIIYRILRVGNAAGRIHVFQRVIEMLV